MAISNVVFARFKYHVPNLLQITAFLLPQNVYVREPDVPDEG